MADTSPDRDFPRWLVFLAAAGAATLVFMLADAAYAQVLHTLMKGVGITLFVTFIAFGLASAVGLVLALATTARLKAIRQAARLYVELIRGVPVIVLLLYIAFAGVPALVAGWNWTAAPMGLPELMTRGVSVLGVIDITQIGKVTAAANFRYLETYNVVAFLYLVMTISLSLALRWLEARLRRRGHHEGCLSWLKYSRRRRP